MKLLPPSGPERRRQVTRLIVLVLLLGAVWWLWFPTARPPRASNPATRSAAESAALPEAIELDTLHSVPELPEAGRNPFVFAADTAPSTPGTAFLTTPRPAAPVVAPTPTAPVGPPPIPLRLTGLTVPVTGGVPFVTLKDTGTNALYQARQGDIVDGRFRLLKVGTQSVVVSYLDGSGMRTLPLGG